VSVSVTEIFEAFQDVVIGAGPTIATIVAGSTSFAPFGENVTQGIHDVCFGIGAVSRFARIVPKVEKS
jgi:hypothetical protein